MADTAEFSPKCVSAAFDGSAAAGAYEPTLTVLAPNGDIVGVFPGEVVAAGASVFVSWFRGIGGSGAGGGTSDTGGVFTPPGGTWNKPPTGTIAQVIAVGGGGGGGAGDGTTGIAGRAGG